MAKPKENANNPAETPQLQIGDVTRQAIKQLPVLTDRLISEFRAEPCPTEQAELREALITSLSEAVNLAVTDAISILECLPKEAQATFDKNITDFHVLETADAILEQSGAGIKDKVIQLVRQVLPFIPKKFAVLRIIIELILAIIQLIQGEDSSTGVLV